MVDPKSYSTASTTLPLNITEPSTSTASTSQSAENTTVPTTLSTLPSSNRATLTPLHNNIKKAGRGGGRIGPRELRQQTINQILPTHSGEPPNVTDSPHSTSKLIIPETIRQPLVSSKTLRIENPASTLSTTHDLNRSSTNGEMGKSYT